MKNNKIAYEFRDKDSLKGFLNKLSLQYKDLDFSNVYRNPLFEVVSLEHPVYVLTPKGEPVYELTDVVPDDTMVINEGNVHEFVDSFES